MIDDDFYTKKKCEDEQTKPIRERRKKSTNTQSKTTGKNVRKNKVQRKSKQEENNGYKTKSNHNIYFFNALFAIIPVR